jgi:cell division protein FtsB
MSNDVVADAPAVLTGTITEQMIKQFVYEFQEEISVTMRLTERIAYDIFGEVEDEDLTPTEAYAYMACEYAKINELEVDEAIKALSRIRFMRALSVLSITMGVPIPTQFLVLDRNVYDTIQAMNVIQKNKQEIDQLAAAQAAAQEVVTTDETVVTKH